MKQLAPAICIGLAFNILMMSAGCKKEPDPNSIYFECNIDGQRYIPNGCTNCAVASLTGDTALLINANRGFEGILIGIINLDKKPVLATTYVLGKSPAYRGTYDNSPLVDDIYLTDSLGSGYLTIDQLDKQKKIISGTFSFDAYNKKLNTTAHITNGKFRYKLDVY